MYYPRPFELSAFSRSGSSTTAELIGVTDAIKVSWKPLVKQYKEISERVYFGLCRVTKMLIRVCCVGFWVQFKVTRRCQLN